MKITWSNIHYIVFTVIILNFIMVYYLKERDDDSSPLDTATLKNEPIIVLQENSTNETNIDITLFQGLPKADKMEYIIQKNVELGVKHIVPVDMERSIVKLDEKTMIKKIERWQKISEVAAKQSGRDIIPKIENIINVKKICELIKNYDIVLIAYENENQITLKDKLRKIKNFDNLKIAVIIGPEGGIDKKELEELIKAGAKTITLGKRILRTETASIVVVSNLIYEAEM